jgi:hypothetical protein
LAARAGVSRQLVAAVEAGRNVPAVHAALARALGTSVEALCADRESRVVPALDALSGDDMTGCGERVMLA